MRDFHFHFSHYIIISTQHIVYKYIVIRLIIAYIINYYIYIYICLRRINACYFKPL